MVKQSPKMTALVVSAIRKLREVQGSTPKDILSYIVAEHNASNPTSDATIQRKLCTALKRGLEYGILKRVHNHYSLNTDPEGVNPADDMLGPMERARGGCGCKSAMGRKRRGRAGGRKGRKGRKGCKSGGGRSRRARKRRSGAGCGGKKRRRGGRKGRSRGGRCKSGGRKSRRRKSRGGSKKCGGKKRRRAAKRSRRRSSRGKKCASGRGRDDLDMLVKDPIETTRHRENIGGGNGGGGGGGGGGGYTYDRDERRSHSHGRQSAGSRSRSPSHSRSSGSSDREGNEENRRDRQAE